jgi:hypothetical protein
MIPPNPRLKVNVAEKLARSIVRAPHDSPPAILRQSESRIPPNRERLFQQPARAVAVITQAVSPASIMSSPPAVFPCKCPESVQKMMLKIQAGARFSLPRDDDRMKS